jgi:hypothetical protein
MPRCYILKKHVNQSRATVKDKSVLGDGNTTLGWQPKTNVALKRHDTPISPTEVNASICYNNTLENQSGKCFLKFLFSSPPNQSPSPNQCTPPRGRRLFSSRASTVYYYSHVCGPFFSHRAPTRCHTLPQKYKEEVEGVITNYGRWCLS